MWRRFRIAIGAAIAILSASCSGGSKEVRNDRVLFLLGEQFDPQEFWGPYATLVAAGYKVDLAGGTKGVVLTPDSDLPEANVRTEIGLNEVDSRKYFALVVPGGPSAANVARYPMAGQIARNFNDTGKFIGTVCHGARLLMPQGVFQNRPATCIFMIADELCDQWKRREYGTYLDLPVVIDKNLVSSRDPRDVPAWSQAMVAYFAQSHGIKVPQRQGRVLIIRPGVTEHEKWVFERLGIFGITPLVWDGIGPFDTRLALGSDMLVLLDRNGTGELKEWDAIRSIVYSFRRSGRPVLATSGARSWMRKIDLTGVKTILAGNIAHAMRRIVEFSREAQGSKQVVYPDTEHWAAEYAKVASTPIKGVPWDPPAEYNAVLALWYGYDDDAAARMGEFLAEVGRKVLIVGSKTGTLTGLNGSCAEVVATYDDRVKLAKTAIIVAPGGIWPKRTKAQQAVQPSWVERDEPARQKRLDWLTAQYKSHRMLVAFGFDSLNIGQQKTFKGKRFASTDQASVIWFGPEGAEYSPERARFSDTNLITAKPLVGVDDAINLLEEYLRHK